MLRTFMISAAVSALMVTGSLAQNAPSPQEQVTAKSDTSSPHFLKEQGTDHFVFSKFRGTNVLGPDDSKVGDVSDLLFDKNGKVLGLIVGVGGFLGIGEKNVAIEMNAFQIVPADTGTTGTNSAVRGSNDPTNVKLKVTWTKDQLKNAPDFAYHKAPARTTGTAAPSTNGMAPRPAAPSPR